MSTRGVKFLQKLKIDFELVRYDHQEKGAAFAAQSTGFPLHQTVKTLVVELGSKKYCQALMPGDRQLNLKALAGVFGVKRAAMVDNATAERVTGYKVGGISPFGTRQALDVVMDASLAEFDVVLINAGQRGSLLRMSPGDIQKATGCRIEPIAG